MTAELLATQLIGGSTPADPVTWRGLDGGTGRVVVVLVDATFPTDVSEAAGYPERLTATLQDQLAPGATTVVVVAGQDCNPDLLVVIDAITIGMVQSVQMEMGSTGLRINTVLAGEGQIQDVQQTLAYFHGPHGGFVAGCSFDLRTQPESEGEVE